MAGYYNEIVPIFETSEVTVARGKNYMTLVGRLAWLAALPTLWPRVRRAKRERKT